MADIREERLTDVDDTVNQGLIQTWIFNALERRGNLNLDGIVASVQTQALGKGNKPNKEQIESCLETMRNQNHVSYDGKAYSLTDHWIEEHYK